LLTDGLSAFFVDVHIHNSCNTSILSVDLSVKSLAILSTGDVIIGAKSYKKHEANLSRMQ
jgi:putative transposase